MTTGVQTLSSGEVQDTALHQGIEWVALQAGASPFAASLIASIGEFGVGAGLSVGVGVVRSIQNAQALLRSRTLATAAREANAPRSALTQSIGSALGEAQIAETTAVRGAKYGLTRAELREVLSSWDQGTFTSRAASIRYHYAKHGGGMSLLDYTTEARAFYTGNARAAQWGQWNPRWAPSFRVMTDGYKGYYTVDGKVITYFPLE